nr:conjugal transfer protein TraG N-terminal domain-containing protein [uncultured Halomonas sp.]
MDFVIYAVGSGQFLTEVLLAIASIFNDGSFVRLAQIGALLGVLIVAFQSLGSGGQGINVTQLAMAFLLYALMFGPKVDVAVEGVFDKHSQAVANVPLGVAAPGAIVSQLGLGVTKMFETAFHPLTASSAPTGLSQGGGFADALKVITSVRRHANDPDLMAAIDDAEPGYRHSWQLYIRNCSAIKIQKGLTSAEKAARGPLDETDGLKFLSRIYHTPVYDSGIDAEPSHQNCGDAYQTLTNWSDNLMDGGDINESVGRLIQSHNTTGAAVGPVNPFTDIHSAMEMLGKGSETAQDYVKTAILEPIYYEAMAGRYKDFNDTNTAVAINSALEQRDLQWAAEQTMFMSIVRPMMTFIEGFAYSITPFMAFIVLMGGFGVKLAIKYGQMLLWIQLWMPVLAVTNFYIHMVANIEMAQFDDFATSFYALDTIDKRLSHWLAVGGMLASATPILTLVLLTGSTYAMTSLASRMQGADHFDEKSVAPAAVQTGAVMQSSAQAQYSSGAGMSRTGTDGILPTYNMQDTASSSVESAQTELNQNAQTLMGQIARASQSGTTLAQKDALSETNTRASNATRTDNANALKDASASFGESISMGSTQSQQFAAELMNRLSAGASLGMGAKSMLGSIGASLGWEQSQTDKFTSQLSNEQTMADVLNSHGSTGWSESDTAAYAESHANQISGMSSEELASTYGESRVDSLTDSAQEVSQSAKSFKEAKSVSESLGSTQTLTAQQIGQNVDKEAVANKFMSTASSDMQSDARRLADRWSSPEGGGMGEKEALAAAQMHIMYSKGGDHRDDFLSLASGISGSDYGNYGSSNMGREVAGANEGVANIDMTPSEMGAGAGGPAPSPSQPLGASAVGGDVQGTFDGYRSEVVDTDRGNRADHANSVIDSAMTSIKDSGIPTGTQIYNHLTGADSAALAGSAGANAASASSAISEGGWGKGFEAATRHATGLQGGMAGSSYAQQSTGQAIERSLGFGGDGSQGLAFASGMMSPGERARAGLPSSFSGADATFFEAGQAAQQGGASAAMEVFSAAADTQVASYYNGQGYSAGMVDVMRGLHQPEDAGGADLVRSGRSQIAMEAAGAKGEAWADLSPEGRQQYTDHAERVVNALSAGMMEGQEGASAAAMQHAHAVSAINNQR